MKTHKTRVALLVGGPSSEHEVSINSGKVVHTHLDKDKYVITPILIDKQGNWPVDPEHVAKTSDVAFIAMHGEYGEDGQVQEILRDIKLPHTGSDVMASSLAMNKILANRTFKAHGINIPNSHVVDLRDLPHIDHSKYELPAVVKPADRGSSVGVSVVRRTGDLEDALHKAFAYSTRAMIEEYIHGRELTCGVVDDGMGNSFPLPVTEIIPGAHFFDYDSKYTKGASEEITPARISDDLSGAVQAIALRAHHAVGASGFSRTDMMLSDEGDLYVIELNTIPGLTETSLIPQAAIAHGMTLPELFDRLIEAAIVRHHTEQSL